MEWFSFLWIPLRGENAVSDTEMVESEFLRLDLNAEPSVPVDHPALSHANEKEPKPTLPSFYLLVGHFHEIFASLSLSFGSAFKVLFFYASA